MIDTSLRRAFIPLFLSGVIALMAIQFKPTVEYKSSLTGEVSVCNVNIGHGRDSVIRFLGTPFVDSWNKVDSAGTLKYPDRGIELWLEENRVVEIAGASPIQVGTVVVNPGTERNSVIQMLGPPLRSDGVMAEYDGGGYWLYLFFSKGSTFERFVVIDKNHGSM